MIVIFGGTGQVGSAILSALSTIEGGSAADTPPVRVLSRRPDLVPRPPGLTIEVQEGNFDSREDVERSLRGGVHTVVLATGDSEGQVARETTIIDIVQKIGGIRIIKISAALAATSPPRAVGVHHAHIEEHLRQSGLPWIIIRPTFFFQALELLQDPINKFSRLPLPLGQGHVSFVDLDDVATSAAALAVSPVAPGGRTFLLTGPHALDLNDLCERLSYRSGRRIKPLRLPLIVFRLMLMLGGGVSRRDAGIVSSVVAACAQGLEDTVTGDIRKIVGREPRSFEDYLSANIDRFLETTKNI